MPHAQFLVSLKLILKNSEGKILALQAHDDGPMAGFYDLPGGRIDDNEIQIPFSKIIKREIAEEIGTEVECKVSPKPSTALSWVWPTGEKITFIYYEAELLSGEIQISDEHLSQKWVDLKETEIDKHFTTYHNAALKQYLQQ